MKLSLTEEQTMIKDMACKFANSVLEPAAKALDRGDDKAAERALFLHNLKQLAELGFMGLNVKSEYGGSDAGVVAFSLALTQVARVCASTAVTMSVTNMVGEVIQAIGSEEQKQRYLPKLCSGDYAAGGFCLSEAGVGSDPAGMKTSAVLDNNEWVLNGTKIWISSAEYAGIFVVCAVTDPMAAKGKGISCFLVEAGTSGLIIGKAEEKMGQHGSATNTVIFDDCRIPKSALMGVLNDGFRIALSELSGGRIGIGSLALGIGQSDAYTQLEASRLLLMSAACMKQEGQPFSKQASMAKLHATETANQVCYTAIQLMGGLGYTREVPLERYARDARVTTIYEGTSEIQRVIIGRELLREI